MTNMLASLFLTCIISIVPAMAQSVTFYVAPNGNDAWTGMLPDSNQTQTDGPFATITQAQKDVQEKLADLSHAGSIQVVLRGGQYELENTWRIGPNDSGREDAPVTWVAWPEETPIISGGRRINGWTVTPEGWWQVTLPEVASGNWNFSQLWVNGERRYRPRWPQEGYAFVETELSPTPENRGKGYDRFRFYKGDIRTDWTNLEDVEVITPHMWSADRMRIKSVDEARRVVNFTAPTLAEIWFFAFTPGSRYLCENVYEALDKPGEWYLNRQTGVLTYIPMPGETPETTEVIAPKLERLVDITCESSIGMYAENLIFDSLTFAHNNWTCPEEGYRWAQSESCLPGAITATGARGVNFRNCKIKHVGTYALELGRGCQQNIVENCEFTDLAAGGVKLGEMANLPDGPELASHNTVRDCLIASGGRMHMAGMGIWIGLSPYNMIEHNEIYDFYQTGISLGWSWGYAETSNHHNTIAYNRIYNIGQGVSSDMGGIYTLGVTPGTVLHHNVIHDISCDGYGGRGIYFDEGTTNIIAENNIVYRTDTGTFMQHYGRDNIVRNNIWALSRGGLIDRLREENHNSFTFTNNIVYYDDEGALLSGNWTNDRFIMNKNLYWNTAGPVLPEGKPFEDWQARGYDTDSIIADPLFVDPYNDDFELHPESPAFKIGFNPIDVSTVGRRTVPPHPPVTDLSARAFPPKPVERPAASLDEDFEMFDPGDAMSGVTTSATVPEGTIKVTDETAYSGTKSLKFTDSYNEKFPWDPHLQVWRTYKEGIVTDSFKIKLEPGAFFYHEWRQYGGLAKGLEYASGPSLWFQPDGWLVANDHELLQLPRSQWIEVIITAGVGPQRTGTYDLSLALPGENAPREFNGLIYGDSFRQLEYTCFTANGQDVSVFYIDDMKLGAEIIKADD